MEELEVYDSTLRSDGEGDFGYVPGIWSGETESIAWENVEDLKNLE